MSRSLRPYTVEIGMDALVRRRDGSSINFGDAIYHPKNVEEARAYALAESLGAPALDAIRERLREAIGHGGEDTGIEHWHHATGGRSIPTERDGVFVDRAEVLAIIDRELGNG